MHSLIESAILAALMVTQSTASFIPTELSAIQERGSDAIDRDAGVSVSGWSSSTCTGTHFANTNVDMQTTACINLSNANAIQITFDQCSTVAVDYYSQTDCKGTKGAATANYAKGSGPKTKCFSLLYDTPPGHASGRFYYQPGGLEPGCNGTYKI